MTNTYILKRLLEHGDLTSGEMLEITGWKRPKLDCAVRLLMMSGIVERKGNSCRGYVFGLSG